MANGSMPPKRDANSVLIALAILSMVGFLALYVKVDLDSSLAAGDAVMLSQQIANIERRLSIDKNSTGAIQYNCKLSGGTFLNGACSCHFESELGQTSDEMYDKTTGFCQTTMGGPAGDAWQASVGLPYGNYEYWGSIFTRHCEQSGGIVGSNYTCACPEGDMYDKATGQCK